MSHRNDELNISAHTVELHRMKVMKKTQVGSLVELTKLVVMYDLLPDLMTDPKSSGLHRQLFPHICIQFRGQV